ncbi:cupin domain-containing protein [Lewinella sp. IMCC34191]|uniref:cupin domain-containing protein n=1 Tax=Lewinella sp. IMCC34191 TaxID=2259172 RepID=UPI000E2866CB|nr:cupin domain-containing protein [Lewinella sp. IMCC34191]
MDTKTTQEGNATLIYLQAWEWIPNSKLPVIVYPGAFPNEKPGIKDRVAKRLQTSGWGNTWVAGIYPYPHYHSNTHEVLVILSGRCTVQLGGPEGYDLEATAGDVIVLPAGTGHACYSKSDYRVFGAYPGGRSWDLITGAPEHREPDNLPVPEQDPIGERGVMRKVWQGVGAATR